MRRSSFIMVLLLTFTIFTLVGFRIAIHTSQVAGLSPQSSKDTHNRRIVLIHVDNLDSKKPQLQSVWVEVFFQSDDQTVLSFIPIYPAPAGQPATNSLERAFSLDKTGQPSETFWRRLDSHNIKQDGYVLIDDEGVGLITGWIYKQGNIANSTPWTPATLPGSQLLELVCRLIQQPTATTSPLNMDSLKSDLRSNLAADDLQTDWKNLLSTEPPVKCELVQD